MADDDIKYETFNPIFGKKWKKTVLLPEHNSFRVQIFEKRMFGASLIGETTIDLEKRFFNRHHGRCGLPYRYITCRSSPSCWRDSQLPSEILDDMCQLHSIEKPTWNHSCAVTISNLTFCHGNVLRDGINYFMNFQEIIDMRKKKIFYDLPTCLTIESGTVAVYKHAITSYQLTDENRNWTSIFNEDQMPSLN